MSNALNFIDEGLVTSLEDYRARKIGGAIPSKQSNDRKLHLSIETERESGSRWIAEIPDLPGVMVYGKTRNKAISSVKALAFRVVSEMIDEDGLHQNIESITFELL